MPSKRNQAASPQEADAYSQTGKLIEKGKLAVIDDQVNTSTGTVIMQATFANANETLCYLDRLSNWLGRSAASPGDTAAAGSA